MKSSGKNGIVDLKNNIKLWYRASENDIASANITNSAKSSSKIEVAEKPISTISALPDDYIPSSEPDYPQLGPGMAVLLGMDSVLNFGIVNVINTVNSFTGKQTINQEVIDYNKETTTDFADRYKVGQATGWGAEVLAIVGLFKGGSVKGTTEGTPKTVNAIPKNRVDLHNDLLNKGYRCNGTSEGGYVTYMRDDGMRVDIRPNGEIITTKKEWLPDNSRKVTVRYQWDGTPVHNGGHNTGEFVDPIGDGTFLPPKPGK